MNRLFIAAGIPVAALCTFGQARAPRPGFEVASVKPAAPQRFSIMVPAGGPGTPDPEHLRYTNVTLLLAIMSAYDVTPDQISGPQWLNSEKYDIAADVRRGATVDEFRLMFQNLLEERFGLALHRESRPFPAFDLVVAKRGPKLTKSTNASDPGMEGRGAIGHMRWTARGQTIEALTKTLAPRLGRPIVDRTGLKGKYDFSLECSTEGLLRPSIAGPPVPAPPSAQGDDGPSIFAALEQQLGLKLPPSKTLLDVLVIDHVNKIPLEN